MDRYRPRGPPRRGERVPPPQKRIPTPHSTEKPTRWKGRYTKQYRVAASSACAAHPKRGTITFNDFWCDSMTTPAVSSRKSAWGREGTTEESGRSVLFGLLSLTFDRLFHNRVLRSGWCSKPAPDRKLRTTVVTWVALACCVQSNSILIDELGLGTPLAAERRRGWPQVEVAS